LAYISLKIFNNCPALKLTALPCSLQHIGFKALAGCSETVQDLERAWKASNSNQYALVAE